MVNSGSKREVGFPMREMVRLSIQFQDIPR
jgi:hypothetical protein